MDGWNVIQEHQANLKPETKNLKLGAKHVWGEDLSGSLQGAGGIGGLLSSVHDVSQTKNQEQGTKNLALFFHYDSNGNVILLTDTTAQPAARYTYDAFGQTITVTGITAELNRYRFSTKPVEPISELTYYGFRYYSPREGRWISKDPIGERGGVNTLEMAGNELVSKFDILGFTTCEEALANIPMESHWHYRCCGGSLHSVYSGGGNYTWTGTTPTASEGTCCGNNWIAASAESDGCCVNDEWKAKIPRWQKDDHQSPGACVGNDTNECLSDVAAYTGVGFGVLAGAASLYPNPITKCCAKVTGAVGAGIGALAGADYIDKKMSCNELVCPN